MKEKYAQLRKVLPDHICPILFDDADFEELVLLNLFVGHMSQFLHFEPNELIKEVAFFWMNIIKNDRDLITDRVEQQLYFITMMKAFLPKRCETTDELSIDLNIMLLKNFQYKKPLR